MIPFEEFEKDMEVILDFVNESDRWNEALQSLMPESSILMDFGFNLLDAFVDKVESSFPYTASSEWINYYLYECNCGKTPMTVSYDNKDIKLDSIEKLYEIMNYSGE